MKSDIIILGSSPNALSAALMWREKGASVTLFENASHFGAPYVTQEGMELGLAQVHLAPELAQRFGLELTCLEQGRSARDSQGNWLRLTPTEVTGASPRDAQRWPEFVALMEEACSILGPLLQSPAPPQDLTQRWRALGQRKSMEVLRLPWMGLRDLLEEWFESDTLRGLLAEVALEHLVTGPYAAGTVYPLLVRWQRGEVLRPATQKGGSGQLISALRTAAEARGVTVVHQPGPVQLEQLQELGERVVSDKDARWTYSRLVSPRDLETEFNQAIRRIRGQGWWRRANGRRQWPSDWPEIHQSDIIHLEPGLARLEKAYDEVKRGRVPEAAPLQVCWPGLVDSSRPGDAVQVTLPWGGVPPLSAIPVDVDYEKDWNCPHHDLWGGSTDLSQSHFLRPVPAFEAPDVELCGVSLHPADFSGRSGAWLAQKF